MNRKQYILFDLDGTLTDPKAGITKSVRHALQSFGIEVNDLDELCRFIGPPLKDAFIEYYSFDEAQAEEAVDKFREYFSVKGLYDNKEYDGISDLLKSLRDNGKTLLVATSKPEYFARKILDYFHLTEYFTFIGGAMMDETRTKKADVIRYVLETMNIDKMEECVMIGDRKHDVLGAKEVGMEAIGVLYGYGDRQELEGAGAKFIAEDINKLGQLLGIS